MKSYQDKYWEHLTKGHKTMFNPSSSVRSFLYVLSVFINATLAVLLAGDVVISIFIIAVVAGFNAVIALMAKSNVKPDES